VQPEPRHRGRRGARGWTDLGRHQVAALADRPLRERRAAQGDGALLLGAPTGDRRRRNGCGRGRVGSDGSGPVRQRCDLCELHAGDADGMEWSEMVEAFAVPGLGQRPDRAIAPGGESWSEFVERASGRGPRRGARAPWRTGRGGRPRRVIEATMIAFPRGGAEVYRRGWVRIVHASMTEWGGCPRRTGSVPAPLSTTCGVPGGPQVTQEAPVGGKCGPGPRARRQARHPRSPHARASWWPPVAARGRRRSRRSAGW